MRKGERTGKSRGKLVSISSQLQSWTPLRCIKSHHPPEGAHKSAPGVKEFRGKPFRPATSASSASGGTSITYPVSIAIPKLLSCSPIPSQNAGAMERPAWVGAGSRLLTHPRCLP